MPVKTHIKLYEDSKSVPLRTTATKYQRIC